jgi:6-carboxyhexanoate--CoA ligase
MHASAGELHVSGAERLVPREEAVEAASALFARGWSHAAADRLTVSVETVAASALVRKRALPVRTVMTRTPEGATECTIALLGGCGVASVLAARTLKLLRAGPGPAGRPMRGAMIVDAVSGERLEPDLGKGVRVSHMDFSRAAQEVLAAALSAIGIEGHRPMEALALATKAATTPGTVAEVCISDDPTYTTGYVASARLGYVRLPHIKAKGSKAGGRALFVDGNALDLKAYVALLRTEPVLVDAIAEVHPPAPWEEILSGLSCLDG